MRLSYITATGPESAYVTAATSNDSIEVKSGTTLAYHHTLDFVVSGEAMIVTNSGTVIYIKN